MQPMILDFQTRQKSKSAHKELNEEQHKLIKLKEKSFSLNTSDFSSSHENMGDCDMDVEQGIELADNNLGLQELQNCDQELQGADLGINTNNKLSSGRKPLPIKYYVHTRKAKIKQLKLLSEDKSLSVADRKKYRAQKFALQRRLNIKVAKHEKKKKYSKSIEKSQTQLQQQPQLEDVEYEENHEECESE